MGRTACLARFDSKANPSAIKSLQTFVTGRLRWNDLCRRVSPTRNSALAFSRSSSMNLDCPFFLFAAADGHVAESLGAQLPLAAVLPFALMLLSIAIFP